MKAIGDILRTWKMLSPIVIATKTGKSALKVSCDPTMSTGLEGPKVDDLMEYEYDVVDVWGSERGAKKGPH